MNIVVFLGKWILFLVETFKPQQLLQTQIGKKRY